MELSDLTREERVVLAALLELVVGSNATVSDDELKEVKHVVSAVGDVAYAEAAVSVRSLAWDAMASFVL